MKSLNILFNLQPKGINVFVPYSDKIEVSREDTNARYDSSRATVEDLTVLINYLINNYGYEIDKQTRRAGKPIILRGEILAIGVI